jgi:asparagine synthase (glutamine-hydrolysing)
MCGLTGFVNLAGAAADPRLLDRMMAVSRHRGPDEEGWFVDRNVALGVQRLSIVDIAGGRQPLFNETETLVLGCNGEIFNYPELRKRLCALGHRFRTNTDVEVLVHLYEDQGLDFLGDLNGQFAFVIVDRRDGTVCLARDPFGICPLFYTVAGSTVIFASEIKSILEHPLVSRAVDVVGLDQLLTFPGLVGSRTMLKGIRALEPGHHLVVRGTGIVRREYWDLIYPTVEETRAAVDEEELVERGAAVFRDAVSCRLLADVPVGIYLSGGLDSSLIASQLPAANGSGPRQAFSVDFHDPMFSEGRYQSIMVQRIRATHHRTVLAVPDLIERLQRAVYHAETPLKETYNAACLSLSESAHGEHIKVVLCGEGADELFAGYAGYRLDRFRAERRNQKREPAEDARRRELWGDPDLVYERSYHEFGTFKKELLFSPAVTRCLERSTDDDAHDWIRHDRLAGRHPLHQRSYLDFKIRLAGHLLADHGDRMAMANSVETRYPFLDPRFVQFATDVPPDLKLNGYTEKYLLKQIGRRCLPAEVTEREKFPFSAPGSPALLHCEELVHEFLAPEVVARQGYFNAPVIQQLTQRYRAPGFRLQVPYDDDLVLYALTFGMLVRLFDLPSLH